MGANSYTLQDFYGQILKTKPVRLGHQFYIEFNGPDATSVGLDANTKYFIKSSKIPAVDVTSAKVAYFGAGFEVPGVVKYPDSWEVKILLESGDASAMSRYLALKKWQENISSYTKSTGGKKTVPDVNARVILLNEHMQPHKHYVMEGVWISKLGDIQFAYEEGSSTIQECTCTFAMQYWYELDTETNPLAAGSTSA
jgi:hypothetical protein